MSSFTDSGKSRSKVDTFLKVSHLKGVHHFFVSLSVWLMSPGILLRNVTYEYAKSIYLFNVK